MPEMYWRLTPREGATHTPSGRDPWTYQYDGQLRSIFETGADGKPTKKPRLIPEGEAVVALQFFSPRHSQEDVEPLVTVEHVRGEERVVAVGEAVAQSVPCKICGQSVPLEEFTDHVLAHQQEPKAAVTGAPAEPEEKPSHTRRAHKE